MIHKQKNQFKDTSWVAEKFQKILFHKQLWLKHYKAHLPPHRRLQNVLAHIHKGWLKTEWGHIRRNNEKT